MQIETVTYASVDREDGSVLVFDGSTLLGLVVDTGGQWAVHPWYHLNGRCEPKTEVHGVDVEPLCLEDSLEAAKVKIVHEAMRKGRVKENSA